VAEEDLAVGGGRVGANNLTMVEQLHHRLHPAAVSEGAREEIAEPARHRHEGDLVAYRHPGRRAHGPVAAHAHDVRDARAPGTAPAGEAADVREVVEPRPPAARLQRGLQAARQAQGAAIARAAGREDLDHDPLFSKPPARRVARQVPVVMERATRRG